MKKYLSVLLVLVLVLITSGCEKVGEDIKLGVSKVASGTRSYVVATVVVKENVVEKALIDEYQYLSGENIICVPNGEETFKNDKGCLASKRENNKYYSKDMIEKGGATKELLESFNAIEKYVKGKTKEELVTFIVGKKEEDLVDAISGCTLDSTKIYLEAIIEAVENAK